MTQRILALQLKRIGDLLLTTPALAALREREPDTEIVLCGGPVAQALHTAMPMVTRVLPWKGNLQGMRTLGAVAAQGYAETYDFTGTERSALLSAVSRAGKRTC